MKTKNKISLLVLIGLFLINIFGAVAQKSIELKYNLEKGDSYIFGTELDQDITFDAMGTTTTLNQLMTFKMTSTITEVGDNEITEGFVFDKITMNQKIFGMELIYDSEDSSTFSGMGAQVAEQFNKIIGNSIKVVIDDRGNFKDMDLSDFSDNNDLSNNLSSGNTHAVYPEGKVKIGDSWETDIKPLADSEMKVHLKYTLLKTTRKQAVLSIEGNITANEIQGQEIKLEGTTVGEMIVDRKTGMLINSVIDMEMALEIDQGGVKIPATIMSSTETNVSKVE